MTRDRKTNLVVILYLFFGTLALYARVAHFGFINFDDSDYVNDNPHVLGGLSETNIAWAFTTGHAANWHPLTWLSLMLDVQLFGPNPGAIHLVNAILHAASSALLFVALLQLTGARWPSAWAAAMFAWHPLHVESVAWISERKDVLSALFFMLCLIAYARYVRKTREPGSNSTSSYALVIVMLALGLMAKPMLVTLPAILLLLDIWPLRRLDSPGSAMKLLIEKLPLFALVAASSAMTYWAQSAGHSVSQVPLSIRLPNVVISYARYLWLTVAPHGLAIFYPMPGDYLGVPISTWQTIVSAIAMLLITLVAILARKKSLAALVGWLWYLGTLVPVIGLVPVGGQSHADRYTYIPLIGIFIAVAWSGVMIVDRWREMKTPLAAGAIASLIVAVCVAWPQIGLWRDAKSVMRHAAEVVPKNYMALHCLGQLYDYDGDTPAALAKYHEAIAANPRDWVALRHLGFHAAKDGNDDAAIDLYRRAIFANPNYGPAYNNYANLLMERGRIDDAISVYRSGIERDPEHPACYHDLALALAQQGKVDEAIPLWQRAVALDPNYTDAHASLGAALLMNGKAREGIAELRAALRLDPDRIDALNSLAWTLATHPNPLYQDGPEALRHATHAVELPAEPEPKQLDTLAAAQARCGKFGEAVKTAERALQLARERRDVSLLTQIEKRVELYRAGKPFTSGQ